MKKLILLFIINLTLITTIYPQWVNTNAPFQWACNMVTDSVRIFVKTTQGIYITSNDGTTWELRNSNLLYISNLVGIKIFGDTLYAFGSALQKMHKADTVWSANWDPGVGSIKCIYVTGSLIIIGMNTPGIRRSTDYGTTWTSIAVGSSVVSSLTGISGGAILAGTDGGIKRSTDSGLTWTNVFNASGFASNDFHEHSSGIYHGGAGILRSTDNGNSWALAGSGIPGFVKSITSSATLLIASVQGYGVYVTTNSPAGWTTQNAGLGTNDAYYVIVKGLYSFMSRGCSNGNGGVWKRLVTEMIGIKIISTTLPEKFELFQNYPNPFNPTTKIKFSIPFSRGVSEGQDVLLKVYDILGHEVATLVNEQLKPGTYEVEWDGSKLSSGVYFYKLLAPGFTSAKKMVLAK